MDKKERIKRERKKLGELYQSLPENRLKLVIPLLDNAAFMAVTLSELQEAINATGCSEEYQNGENQRGRKASADLQAYNQTMKIYSTVIDKLDKMLPEQKQSSRLSDLLNE